MLCFVLWYNTRILYCQYTHNNLIFSFKLNSSYFNFFYFRSLIPKD